MSAAAALPVARELAETAGQTLLEFFGKLGAEDVGSKSVQRDLVTRADVASEEQLLAGLREAFPADGFHAEESGVRDAEREHVWYVDPLDGTVNFVHRLPAFCVSIARVTDGVPDVAVVHAPLLGETFTAVRGGGAKRGEERLRCSASTALGESLLATGFPYKRQTLLDNNLENFNRLFLKVRGMRRMGSAALDLAWVAAGRIDAFWELHLGPYDVAAGGLLVAEAGGIVDTIVPGGDWIHGRNVVAGPTILVDAIRSILLEGRGADYPPLGEAAVEDAAT